MHFENSAIHEMYGEIVKGHINDTISRNIYCLCTFYITVKDSYINFIRYSKL